MIQRFQTIFLLIIVGVMIAMPFLSLYTKVDPDQGHVYMLTALALKTLGSNGDLIRSVMIPYCATACLSILIGFVALIEIFQYNNRLLQIKLGALNAWLITALIGVILYFSLEMNKSILEDTTGDRGIGFILPAVAILSNLIANRLIRRDENLVRSADRMR